MHVCTARDSFMAGVLWWENGARREERVGGGRDRGGGEGGGGQTAVEGLPRHVAIATNIGGGLSCERLQVISS